MNIAMLALDVAARLRHPRASRAHRDYVRTQNAHLDGSMHSSATDPADPSCTYCVARSADLAARARTGHVASDDPRLLPADRPSLGGEQ